MLALSIHCNTQLAQWATICRWMSKFVTDTYLAFVVLLELGVLDDHNGRPDNELLLLHFGFFAEPLPFSKSQLRAVRGAARGAGPANAKLLVQHFGEFAVELDAAGAHGASVRGQRHQSTEPVDGARTALARWAVPLPVVLGALAVRHAVQVLEKVPEPLDLLLILMRLLRK